MAPSNLKEFNNQWIMFGLLLFSMLTFAITFVANNSPDALGSSWDRFNQSSNSIQSNLVIVQNSSNDLLNVSAENNPEVSDLGSKDSVAVSYGFLGTAKTFADSFKIFMGWLLTGTAGQILLTVLTGLFSFSALYFITKWIRSGS